MKSYWIVAVATLVAAWPSSSTAYAACRDQAGSQSAGQTQPSTSSEASNVAAKPPQSAPAEAAAAASNPATAASATTKPSFLLVELSKTLKANKLKPGDSIKARVSQDVISRGKIVIPADTELVGHVTEVAVRNDGRGESRLGFVFDRIKLKHFHDVNFNAVVQAVSAPMQRRSKVDEPSQMLPPSMVGGGRDPGTSMPGGRSNSGNRSSSSSSGPQLGAGASFPAYQVPLTVKQSPSTHAATGSSAALLETAPSGPAMSVGMPQGVIGLKGLSLTSGPTTTTPGPVVISSTDNVKLESDTQILLRVMSVERPQEPARK